jgi:hypothetical protein
MPLQSISQGPFIKGVVASTGPLAQPKGSVSRISNLVMTSRGALDVCDGTGIINWFNGAVQTGTPGTTKNKMLAETLFDPTGVAPYYLALKQAALQRLGPPKNLAGSAGGTGGTLTTGTYYYKVTAIDGAGGETNASAEVSVAVTSPQVVTLTWNVVPNAFGYNVYRGTSPGGETLLVGTNLPVLQVAPGTLTVTFVDTGAASSQTFSVGTATVVVLRNFPSSQVATVNFTGVPAAQFPIGIAATYVAGSDAHFNTGWTVTQIVNSTTVQTQATLLGHPLSLGEQSTGGTLTFSGAAPPLTDTTSQLALYLMPSGTIPIVYNDSNIVALFPINLDALNVAPSGGTGAQGLNIAGTLGNQASTPNGGITGMTSLLPQFAQFTNRMIIALGNGFPPQAFSDATGTPTNPAFVGTISAISVDAFGVVTVTFTTAHGLDATQAVGANVILANVTNANYDGVFVIISIPSTTSIKVRNLAAIGSGPSSGGTGTITTIPLISTFVPAYPAWTASTPLLVGDLIVPTTQPSPAIYLTVIQAGTTGTVEPTWPTGGLASIGKQIQDTGGSAVRYQVAGLLNSAAPAPPGASHLAVFSGALWILNTAPTNTATGLDGPTSLRQSSINNPNSWNPVNQAFLDKDDGTEGMGLAKFTITAQGIPPEGSLVAFKNFSPYQIIGVFGAANLTIQAVSSDMGCIAPRTILFVPGFGITRYSHLGVAIFNGVKDEIVSEQIRPYFFPSNIKDFSDITVVDATWVAVSWAAIVANPPMYSLAMPIGNSLAQLTRIFSYDLVLKAWDIQDLPFAISSMAQVRSIVSNPLTIFGGYLDGVLQRWQAGDLQWYTGGGVNASNVAWSFRSLTVASNDTDQRVYVRRFVVTGTNGGATGLVAVTANQSGVPQFKQTFSIPANQDFDTDFAVGLTGKRFDITVSGSINVEIDGCTAESEGRPAGVVVAV